MRVGSDCSGGDTEDVGEAPAAPKVWNLCSIPVPAVRRFSRGARPKSVNPVHRQRQGGEPLADAGGRASQGPRIGAPSPVEAVGRPLEMAQAGPGNLTLFGRPTPFEAGVPRFVFVSSCAVHDVIPGVNGEFTADQVRAAAFRVDIPYGREINGGGVQFSLSDTYNGGQNRQHPPASHRHRSPHA